MLLVAFFQPSISLQSEDGKILPMIRHIHTADLLQLEEA